MRSANDRCGRRDTQYRRSGVPVTLEQRRRRGGKRQDLQRFAKVGEEAAMFSAEFLVTSLVVVLIPGTGVIFTVSTGLSRGRRASFFASIGCTLGIVPHLLATV